jgi:hypothetical protein
MFPTEDGDRRCLMCGEVRYDPFNHGVESLVEASVIVEVNELLGTRREHLPRIPQRRSA